MHCQQAQFAGVAIIDQSLQARAGAFGQRSLATFCRLHPLEVVARASQLVPDIRTGLEQVQEKYKEQPPSRVSFHTGPSRTADIEKTLVKGAHGPKELILFLIDDGAD